MTRSINSGTLGPQDFLGNLCQFSSNPHTWTRGFSLIPEPRFPRRVCPKFFLFHSLWVGTKQRAYTRLYRESKTTGADSVGIWLCSCGDQPGLQYGCLVWVGCPCQHVAITCRGGISFHFFSWKQRVLLWKCIPSLLSLFQDFFFVGSYVPSFGGRKAITEIFLQGRKQEIPTRSLPCSTGLETRSLLWTNVPVRIIT